MIQKANDKQEIQTDNIKAMMLKMMDKITTIMDTVALMQEALLIMYVKEDGDEKKEKLKECAKKIIATIVSKPNENKRKITEVATSDEEKTDEKITEIIDSEDESEDPYFASYVKAVKIKNSEQTTKIDIKANEHMVQKANYK